MNYQTELDNIIKELEANGRCIGGAAGTPTLLLHSCCGPCSSYVLEYLSRHFDITVFYFNPCIFPADEYEHRKAVQKELIRCMNESENQSDGRAQIKLIEGDFDHGEFLKAVMGHETDPEGGERCHICYRQRLNRTAALAKSGGFDYFTTTLSVSPYKNAEVLNAVGLEAARDFGVSYLISDFKKRNGYKRSIELSKAYNLYRQDYCGCEFSKREG